MYKKVQGHPNLYKNTKTGVIVNREDSERTRYRLSKQQAMSNLQMKSEVETLRNEVSELKSLMLELLQQHK